MEQNKISKYLKYALGEILLVMIGILLALQVNTWNQKRISKNKESLLLNELHREFKLNRTQLDTVILKHQIALQGCEKLIEMFPIDVEYHNLDTISKYLINSLASWTFNPSQGVIKSITNTSSFDIISDGELRKLLVSWQDLVLDYQEDEIDARVMVQTMMEEYLMSHFSYDFDFTDQRNDFEVLESREFEYLIKLRRSHLLDILGDHNNLDELELSVEKIIALTTIDQK